MQTIGEESSIAVAIPVTMFVAPGTGRGNSHTHAPGSPRVAIGHVRCALFVAHQNVMDIAVLQRVIGRKNRAAGITEYSCHPLLLQTFPENLRACLQHNIFHPIEDWTFVPKFRPEVHPIQKPARADPSLGASSGYLAPHYTRELELAGSQLTSCQSRITFPASPDLMTSKPFS